MSEDLNSKKRVFSNHALKKGSAVVMIRPLSVKIILAQDKTWGHAYEI